MASVEQLPPIGVLQPSPAAGESETRLLERVLSRVYTLDWETIFYVGMFIAAILSRFIGIGDRVLSHDESLHSKYSFDLWQGRGFTHTPLMHGPVIFHMTALSFFLFGDSDATARFYPAVLGVIIVLLPKLMFERWLGKRGAMVTSVLLLISPMVLFHSRYIREDIPAIFFTLLMVYALLRYIDPARPRQIRWLMLLAGGTVLSLASKETGFMYVAIFGSFLTLLWLIQVIRDLRTGELDPVIGQILGGLLGIAILGGLAYLFGGSIANLLPHFSRIAVQGIVLALLILVAGAFFTPIRRLSTAFFGQIGERSYSIFMLLMNGIVLGAIASLIMTVIVNIAPLSTAFGTNDGSAAAVATATLTRSHIIIWTIVMAVMLIGLVIGTALIGFWKVRRLPWAELVSILAIAVVVCAAFLFLEERSKAAPNVSSDHAASVEPGSTTGNAFTDSQNTPIWISWGVGGVAIVLVLGLRFATPFFQEMKRYPTFDTLITMGTLILPWLAAYPLFQAGYALDVFPPSADTAQAALFAEVPFVGLAIVTGLCWNPTAWLASAATFYSIFAFFYTTIFTNSGGIYSGVVGSLGYWLAQQGVRRGSQPQFYYMVVQLPVYEFLPSIGGLVAATAGMIAYWWYRAHQYAAALTRSISPAESDNGAMMAAAIGDPLMGSSIDPITALDSESGIMAESGMAPLDAIPAATVPLDDGSAGAIPADTIPLDDEPFDAPPFETFDTIAGVPFGTASTTEPIASEAFAGTTPLVDSAVPPAKPPRIIPPIPAWIEKLETVPFLAFVGYWAVMILYAFTLSGEKMPWLTTQLTIPMILATGFFLGTVLDHVEWAGFFRRGWWMLIFIPILAIGLANVIGPFLFGQAPFGGLQRDQLLQTGTWLAAVLLCALIIYGVYWVWRKIGLRQTARIALLGAFVLLAILTARTAYRFAYIDYDYATEFGVYAHGAPAYKVAVSQMEQLSKQTTDGMGLKVAYDDLVSWPGSWYFRNFTNATFLGDTSSATDLNTYAAIMVGQAHGDTVEAQLGDQYYKYNFIRMWWPMQDYFNLSPDKLDTFTSPDPTGVVVDTQKPSLLREGIWDIWWDRTYDTYGKATGQNFDISQWPVVDRMNFYVRKDVAAQVWNMGVGGADSGLAFAPDPFTKLRCTDCTANMTITGTDLSSGALNQPHGMAIGPDGNLYLADTLNARILILDPVTGKLISQFGMPDSAVAPDATTTPTPAPGQFKEPWAIAVGADGWVYVADTWNSRVQVFDAQHNPKAQWGHQETLGGAPGGAADGFWGPRGIAVDEQNRVYVADTGNKRIRVYDRTGNLLSTIGGPGAGNGKLNEPVGLAYDAANKRLYVADTWNKRIQAFNVTDGSYLTSWSVDGWKGSTEDTGTRPFLALDPTGTRLYATEPDFGEVLVWDVSQLSATSAPVPLLQFGVKGTSLDNVHFNLTSGVVVAKDGSVFVADSGDNRVMRFAAGALPRTAADTGISSGGAINPLLPIGTQAVTEAVTQAATSAALGLKTQAVTQPATQAVTQIVRVPAATVPVTQAPTQAATQASTQVTGF